ncbi:HlyC/CorC family transporter [Candidatus Dependentiae bacterium]|nr:HlyC/CorC family transporter [Candidatus Dependentiae bacterium]
MYDFPQYSILFSGIMLTALSSVFNSVQSALLTFGKYKTHKLIEGKTQYRELLKKYIEKFWDYYFSITIIASTIRIVLILVWILFFNSVIRYLAQRFFINYYDLINQRIILYGISAVLSGTFTLLLSEIIPGVIARKNSEKVILSFLDILKYADILLSPFRYIFMRIAGFILKPFEIVFEKKDFLLEDEDVKALFKAAVNQGLFKVQEYDMVTNIFELKDTIVRNIMIPQTDVISVPSNIDLRELLNIFDTSGYSRLPVFEKNRDNIIGVIHAKEILPDLFEKNDIYFDIKKFIRKIIYVPESKEINSLLRDFQREKTHIAAVVDEFGVFAGIITIEDILEEIVGEIEDEFDDDDESIVKNNNKEFIIDAKLNLEELNEKLNIDLPVSENYESLGGFLIFLVDELPEQGREILYNGYKFVVVSATKTRIFKVKLNILENI